MPLSVLEAMALGLPVVSTNVGGIPFLIQDNLDGYLVGKNDVSGMANKIMQILDNTKKARSIIKKARKKVEGFDWDQVRVEWANLMK
ncbi:MAG: glycosyltransferase family 4 protein, partial [Flavobacteriaceae bacterium]|nr:glycosyltransferase family 4 protein [Flavobacteriaceae bacterium]